MRVLNKNRALGNVQKHNNFNKVYRRPQENKYRAGITTLLSICSSQNRGQEERGTGFVGTPLTVARNISWPNNAPEP
jgi:hypothetical protein